MKNRELWAVCGGIVLGVLVVLGIYLVQAPGGSSKPPGPANTATRAQAKAGRDTFGIQYLRPTLVGGTYWVSHWGPARVIDGVDPKDPWFDAAHGNGSERAKAGILYVTGENPRMYVHDPEMKRQWRNIEATVYFKRVADQGVPYAGMTIVARTNHLDTSGDAQCDTRGVGGRMRFDGHVDFEKETAYPRNQAIANRTLWPSGMPYGQWIGMKFIVWDEPDGVHLQVWRDLANGADGGHWTLVDTTVDHGGSWGKVPCAKGINPAMTLTASPTRAGSESGLPNLCVFFRSDGIDPDGLEYKWASIREITVQ